MSKEMAKEIIRKAKSDEKFMQVLLANPKSTIANYDLTPVEIEFFTNADRKSIEGLKDSCFELA